MKYQRKWSETPRNQGWLTRSQIEVFMYTWRSTYEIGDQGLGKRCTCMSHSSQFAYHVAYMSGYDLKLCIQDANTSLLGGNKKAPTPLLLENLPICWQTYPTYVENGPMHPTCRLRWRPERVFLKLCWKQTPKILWNSTNSCFQNRRESGFSKNHDLSRKASYQHIRRGFMGLAEGCGGCGGRSAMNAP